jgi:starvation-inducible DNA-binding protein
MRFSGHAIDDIASHLNPLLADVSALYLKTRRVVASNGCAHPLLAEHAEQLVDLSDALAGRVRAIGGTTVHSVSDIARLQRLAAEKPADAPPQCLAALRADNLRLAAFMLSAQATCEKHRDVATASLLEDCIDDARQRAWRLAEASRQAAA